MNKQQPWYSRLFGRSESIAFKIIFSITALAFALLVTLLLRPVLGRVVLFPSILALGLLENPSSPIRREIGRWLDRF